MKNKKGFTLVEILSVIVLISLLLGLGIPGISRISKNMKERSYKTKVNLIEQAAVLWGQDNKTRLQTSNDCIVKENGVEKTYSCYKIAISELIEDDYLDKDQDDKYINPKDNSDISNKCVYVYKKNNRVYSYYSDKNEICDKKTTITTTTTTMTTTTTIPDPSGTSELCEGTTLSSNSQTLACNILKNALKARNDNSATRTKYYSSSDLPTKIAEEISKEDEKVLASTEDDYGTSYYFRGNVLDNYVNFAGMCWRIVRIAGDESVKLILEDRDTTCNSSSYTGNWYITSSIYGYQLKNVDSDTYNESIMSYLNPTKDADYRYPIVKAFYDFQSKKLTDYTSKLKGGDWCLGDKAYKRSGSSKSTYTYTSLEEYDYSNDMYYDSYVRLSGENSNGYSPTLKCNGTILNEFADVVDVSNKAPMYVSTITADEMVYAGGKFGGRNESYYLLNDFQKFSYQCGFWSLSPYSFDDYRDYATVLYSNGYLATGSICGMAGGNTEYSGVRGQYAVRPSVSLASGAVITGGDGTIVNPYIVE